MLRKLAVLALVLSLSGCSTEEEDKQVLIDYVAQLQALDDKNKQIAETIEHLRKPIGEISAEDLATARQLIVDYVTQLQALPRDLSYRELRVTHTLYVDKVTMAIELSGDKGREMRREKSTVDIGLHHIEQLTKRHYNAIDILWLRQIISDPYPLVFVWRKQN